MRKRQRVRERERFSLFLRVVDIRTRIRRVRKVGGTNEVRARVRKRERKARRRRKIKRVAGG